RASPIWDSGGTSGRPALDPSAVCPDPATASPAGFQASADHGTWHGSAGSLHQLRRERAILLQGGRRTMSPDEFGLLGVAAFQRHAVPGCRIAHAGLCCGANAEVVRRFARPRAVRRLVREVVLATLSQHVPRKPDFPAGVCARKPDAPREGRFPPREWIGELFQQCVAPGAALAATND